MTWISKKNTKQPKRRRLQLEALEDRFMPAVNLAAVAVPEPAVEVQTMSSDAIMEPDMSVSVDKVGPNGGPALLNATSVAVYANYNTGYLHVNGTLFADEVEVEFDNNGTTSPYDDEFVVTTTTLGQTTEHRFDYFNGEQWLQDIRFDGGAGDDEFYNNTHLATLAFGGIGNDTIQGGNAADVIYGLGGDDILAGGGGNDTIFGGLNDDWILGGDGNDTLDGESGNDILLGEQGEDTLRDSHGNNQLFGGSGDDTIWSFSMTDVYIQGGDGDDFIYVQGGSNLVYGNDGDDEITMAMTTGDTIYAGKGNDTVVINSWNGNDHIYAGDGNDHIYAGGGHDVVFGGNGNDTLDGGTGNDVLYGEAGNDMLLGSYGNDGLYGGDHADVLIGGYGVDTLHGQGGDDFLNGSLYTNIDIGDDAYDYLYGGEGNDTFAQGDQSLSWFTFYYKDQVMDLEPGETVFQDGILTTLPFWFDLTPYGHDYFGPLH